MDNDDEGRADGYYELYIRDDDDDDDDDDDVIKSFQAPLRKHISTEQITMSGREYSRRAYRNKYN